MKKRPRDTKPIHPSLASSSGPALIKHLASCNTTVRSQSLRLIQSWLSAQSQELSDSDIKRLWKGLFYCLWHADKTPNQVALIDRLISLFLSLKSSVALDFFRGFLVTLRREWSGIDRLRLDKFYLLIRRFMKAVFELMRLMKWDVGVLGDYFGVLEKDGFLAEDKKQGNGVNYHVVSVFLEELKGVSFPVRKEVVHVILRPFFAVLLKSKDRILLAKLKSCVFDELMKLGKEMLANKWMEVDCDESDGNGLLGLVSLKMGLSGKFYEVGSSVECVQGNRKVALGLHEEFLKLEKELELSGIEISIPEYIDADDKVDDDDEVPQLIHIECTTSNSDVEMVSANDAHEDDKKVKKSKKAKKKKRKDDNGVSEINPVVKENSDSIISNGIEKGHSSNDDSLIDDVNGVELDEAVISNLQKAFENVAAETGSDISDIPLISIKQGKRMNKRKRIKGVDSEFDAKSVDKSAKKVRFSMKNNLVWKPQTPLPPESLRLPPSVTPRGSALKKGVPPGPVIEMPLKRKMKPKRKLKSASAVIKRRKNIQTRSA